MEAVLKNATTENYKKTPVAVEKVVKVMRAAMASPDASDQKWDFYVTFDPDTKKMIAESSADAVAQAPVVAALGYKGAEAPAAEEINQSLALMNMLNMAEELDLSCLWINLSGEAARKVRRDVNAGADVDVFGVLAMGYSEDETEEEKQNKKKVFDHSRVHFMDPFGY